VFWGEQQVDMIGHQDVRMELTALALQGVAQPANVGVAILVIEEAGPTIVATLHDVQRYTVDVDARTAGHGRSLAEIEPGPFSSYLLHCRRNGARTRDRSGEPPLEQKVRSDWGRWTSGMAVRIPDIDFIGGCVARWMVTLLRERGCDIPFVRLNLAIRI
jgi:hypothetical protein